MLRNDKDDVDVLMSLYHIKGNMFFPHCHAHHWQMEGCPSIFHAKPLATERQMESLSKMKGALGQYWPLGPDIFVGHWCFQILAMSAMMTGW